MGDLEIVVLSNQQTSPVETSMQASAHLQVLAAAVHQAVEHDHVALETAALARTLFPQGAALRCV